MKQVARQQAGFTIVELVAVIIVLSILAAVALPRFMEAAERGHDSNVLATSGALAESVTLFRTQWFVNGNSNGDPETNVNGFSDGLVDSNAGGWPVCYQNASAPECTTPAKEWGSADFAATITDAMCVDVWEGLLGATAPSAAAAAGPGIVYLANTPTAAEATNPPLLEALTALLPASTGPAGSPNVTCIYTYLPDDDSDAVIGGSGPRYIVYDTSTGTVSTNVLRLSEEGS